MWWRSACPLLASSDEEAYVRINSWKYERRARLRPTAARRIMQRDEDVPFLVSSIVCVCPWFLRIAWLENGFVDVVARVYGRTMFAERLQVRPHPLLLHRPVFHPWCSCFVWIRCWIFAVWTIRMEMDLRRNSYWRYRPHLHSRTHSRSLSTKSTRRDLTKR